MNIAIIKLPSDKWHLYRDMRLSALKNTPTAFASSFEQEKQFNEEVWRQNIDNMWFAVSHDQLIGMVGLLLIEQKNNTHIGYLVSLWVLPEFQKRKAGQALIRELQNFATKNNLIKIALEVTASNREAVGLYEKMGFKKIKLLKNNLLKDGKYLDEFLMEWEVSR